MVGVRVLVGVWVFVGVHWRAVALRSSQTCVSGRTGGSLAVGGGVCVGASVVVTMIDLAVSLGTTATPASVRVGLSVPVMA
jgi:hypothetical protein